MSQYNRDNLLKMYKKSKFPKEKICQDCFNHSEIIFNTESTENQLKINQFHIQKDFYFIETEDKKLKLHKEISDNSMNWRTQRTDQTGKPKDQKQPLSFRKVLDTSTTPNNNALNINEVKANPQYNTEPSITEQHKTLHEEILNVTTPTNNNFNPSEQKVLPNNIIQPNMGFNQNHFFNFMQQQNAMFQQFIPNLIKQGDPNFDPNFDIKVLLKYNKKLHYPENLPLWYMWHPMIKSSFGPMTTTQIENMYNSKQIFSNSLIRFVDIYERRNHNQFDFFPIKELEDETLLNEVIPSKILKYLYVDNLSNDKEVIIVNSSEPKVQEITVKHQDEELDEELHIQTQENEQSNKKSKKKKTQHITREDSEPKQSKNYNPSITSYNTNPTISTFVVDTPHDSNDWEQVGGKVKKPEKTNKVIGTNTNKTNNTIINQTKKPTEKPHNFEPNKLVEMLNPKKKLESTIDFIETDTVSQSNKNNPVLNNKGKKGGKQKFTDLNVVIGVQNVGGDVYKVESKKKK